LKRKNCLEEYNAVSVGQNQNFFGKIPTPPFRKNFAWAGKKEGG